MKRRFANPSVLNDSTRILGSTAKEWDQALTGNMEKALAEVKRRVVDVETARKLGHRVKIEVSTNNLPDLASSFKKRLEYSR